jgi:hypothetical protein
MKLLKLIKHGSFMGIVFRQPLRLSILNHAIKLKSWSKMAILFFSISFSFLIISASAYSFTVKYAPTINYNGLTQPHYLILMSSKKAARYKQPVKLLSGNAKNDIYPSFLTRNPFHTFLYTKQPKLFFKEGELPLMQYSLSSLKIVGIMARSGHYYAMLQTPDGRSYIVSDGSVVGVSRARITSITDNSIIFIEKTFNALGQMHIITIVMKIK